MLHFRRLSYQAQQGRIAQPVVDVASLAPVRDDPALTQRHQVLGEGRLPETQHGFKVTDAGLALTDRQQDLDAGCGADGPDE